MNDDAILLQRYANESCAESFTKLVHRHVDLVYSAALRRTGGDPHRAADVSQEVFTALARNARKLVHHPALTAWLHATTRNAALNLMVADQRRKQREQVAVELAAANQPEAPADWVRLRDVLDAAIDELPEMDRAAVLLRCLERRGFAEIGAALALSEDAARMRTDRALEKLRVALVRRGITSAAAALGGLVSTHATTSAPAGLAASLATNSLAAAGAGGGVLAGLAQALSAKSILGAATVGAIGFALGTYLPISRAETAAPANVITGAEADSATVSAKLRAENLRLVAQTEQLAREVAALNAANARLTADLRAAARPGGRRGPSIGKPDFEVQTGMLNNLRQLAAARDQYRLENGRWPTSVHDLVGSTLYIRRLNTVDGEEYSSLPMDGSPMTVTTPAGLTMSYGDGITTPIDEPEPVRRARQLGDRLEPSVRRATEAYRLANQGRDPRDEPALIPYFATPPEGADYVELLEARKQARRY